MKPAPPLMVWNERNTAFEAEQVLLDVGRQIQRLDHEILEHFIH
jgi:hypothetical protein